MVSCAECISANQPTNRQSTWMPFRMPATYGRRLKLYIPISFPPSIRYTQHCETQIATDEKMSPPLPFAGERYFHFSLSLCLCSRSNLQHTASSSSSSSSPIFFLFTCGDSRQVK